MFPIAGKIDIYLCTRPVDMRKAYDGLSAEVVNYMGQEPTSGNLFVFVNRPRNRMKILYWESHGFWLLCKRLEAGRFQMPVFELEETSVDITYEQLMMIVEGIDLRSIRHRKRFSFKKA